MFSRIWTKPSTKSCSEQIERRSDFCLTGGFGIALLFHQFRAGKAEFYSCIGVNGVVDAAVVRNIAAGHAGVCSVHDSKP